MHPGIGPVLPLGHVPREDRRGVIDGRVDRAVLRLRVAPEMGQQRVLAIIARPVVIFHVSSTFSPTATGPPLRPYCSRAAGRATEAAAVRVGPAPRRGAD